MGTRWMEGNVSEKTQNCLSYSHVWLGVFSLTITIPFWWHRGVCVWASTPSSVCFVACPYLPEFNQTPILTWINPVISVIEYLPPINQPRTSFWCTSWDIITLMMKHTRKQSRKHQKTTWKIAGYCLFRQIKCFLDNVLAQMMNEWRRKKLLAEMADFSGVMAVTSFIITGKRVANSHVCLDGAFP